ncbi:hypothetical protein BDQ17DRAFT_1358788 [Cyathus striatus]|nr:hypothetical protein BDQ17DRAFT_1358788 [Cyathus striatus]
MSAELEKSAVDTYHPKFSSLSADVILRSADGTLYRVPKFTLRRTCGYFRTLLPVPTIGELLKREEEKEEKEQVFEIAEPEDVLERVLCLICGLEPPQWETFDDLASVARLVEFLDAPGPLSILQGACTSPLFLAEPIRLYGLARRYGWEEESQIASSHTLSLSLYEKKHEPQLASLTAKDLMALLGLHRRRRDEFKKAIDGDLFNAGNAVKYSCTGCGEEVDNHPWRELKARMFLEMDWRPLGDTICALDMEEWPEAVACWSAKCKKEGCGDLYYNKVYTLRDIKACIDRLPETV